MGYIFLIINVNRIYLSQFRKLQNSVKNTLRINKSIDILTNQRLNIPDRSWI